MKNNIYQNNFYYNLDSKNFLLLLSLIQKHKIRYSTLIKNKYPELFQWINNCLPLLSNSVYSLPTKCYWILNNIKEFTKCKHCGKNIGILKNIRSQHNNYGYPIFCSLKCSKNNSETNEKYKNTCIKKYNVSHFSQTVKFKKKFQKTCIKHFGTNFPLQQQINKNKAIQTKILKYNDKNYTNRNKAVKTFIEHFYNNKKFHDEYLAKREQTCLLRYGCTNGGASKQAQQKIKRKYFYNNIYFDSSIEIALYIYLTDKHIQFEYHPNISFTYTVNNKIHQYYPDFLIENIFYEIKGSQFLNKNTGKWINPYNRTADHIMEEKQKCLFKNNVKILYPVDYAKYVKYINIVYGKNYLKQFKNV